MIARVALLTALGIGSAAGCAYYNGLYNANQLANDARRAEAEGRRGEARSLWLQAAVKAESVVVRYPDSKYRDDALLMQGVALHAVGLCQDAIPPLEAAHAASPDPSVRANAGLHLGQCYFEAGRNEAAWSVLTSLLVEADSALADQARWWRAKVALARGDAAAALADLDRVTTRDALFDRAEALWASNDVVGAGVRLDSARQLPYAEDRWAGMLDAVASVDLELASDLVDRLVQNKRLTDGQRARLLLVDGERWETIDRGRAEARFRRVTELAGDSVEGRTAHVRWAISQTQTVTALDSLEALAERFERAWADGGPAGQLASPYATMLRAVVVDLGTPGEDGDLRRFRLAELIRDSLAIPALAVSVFTSIPGEYPASPIAPKALLAAVSEGLAGSDSLLAWLRSDYPDSPYTRAALGLPAPGYSVLEDSLRRRLSEVSISQGRRR